MPVTQVEELVKDLFFVLVVDNENDLHQSFIIDREHLLDLQEAIMTVLDGAV